MILIAQELQKRLENGQTVGACDYQQKQHSYFRQHGVIDCVCVVDMMDGVAHAGDQQTIHELYAIEMSPITPTDTII